MPEMMPQVDDGELFMTNTLTIGSEHRTDFLRALATVLPQARALAGCILLEVGEIVCAPGTFVLTERWRSGREYVEEYLSLPFYRAYLAHTEDMYAGPRTVTVLRRVDGS